MYEFKGCRFDLLRCPDCGNVQVHPLLKGPSLTRLYTSPGYFMHDYDSGVTASSYLENRGPILARYRYAEGLLRRHRPGKGRLLEVGCAHGFFLEEMARRGWDVRGVEIASQAVRQARRRGLKVFRGDLFAARFAPSSFDAVLLGDVLEHVPDPVLLLREIRRILRPGGVLVVKCPRFLNSWGFRAVLLLACLLRPLPLGRIRLLGLMKIPWHRQAPGRPYHLYEFNKATMGMALERSGFEVAEMRSHVIRITFVEHLTRNPVLHAIWWSFFMLMRGLCIVLDLPFGSVVAVARKR
jgi:SAM-dependent methyltransferase